MTHSSFGGALKQLELSFFTLGNENMVKINDRSKKTATTANHLRNPLDSFPNKYFHSHHRPFTDIQSREMKTFVYKSDTQPMITDGLLIKAHTVKP